MRDVDALHGRRSQFEGLRFAKVRREADSKRSHCSIDLVPSEPSLEFQSLRPNLLTRTRYTRSLNQEP